MSPYASGYDHGCDDADISDRDNRYINQPEKGPSFHTDDEDIMPDMMPVLLAVQMEIAIEMDMRKVTKMA
jgi:hypothetical protein